MKAITIKEPFATLIKNKKKYIETRSWKTNYRGEIYIHAGVAKLDKSIKARTELSKLYTEDELNFGNIICKCNLVDCVYMDEKFIEEAKKNHDNYVSGYYSVGRYAWILDNIEVIKPIPKKGQLGIWNFNDKVE